MCVTGWPLIVTISILLILCIYTVLTVKPPSMYENWFVLELIIYTYIYCGFYCLEMFCWQAVVDPGGDPRVQRNLPFAQNVSNLYIFTYSTHACIASNVNTYLYVAHYRTNRSYS